MEEERGARFFRLLFKGIVLCANSSFENKPYCNVLIYYSSYTKWFVVAFFWNWEWDVHYICKLTQLFGSRAYA